MKVNSRENTGKRQSNDHENLRKFRLLLRK